MSTKVIYKFISTYKKGSGAAAEAPSWKRTTPYVTLCQ